MTAFSFKITNKLLNKILIEFKENPDIRNYTKFYWNE